MFPGVATALAGAGLVAYTHSYFPITFGAFLVGIGWAAANVSATALIADHYVTATRGRALGFNDTCAAGISVLIALATGPLISWVGLSGAGLMAILFAIPPLAMLATTGGTKRIAARAARRNGRRQQRRLGLARTVSQTVIEPKPRHRRFSFERAAPSPMCAIGFLAQDFGYTVGFFAIAAVAACGLAVIFLFMPETDCRQNSTQPGNKNHPSTEITEKFLRARRAQSPLFSVSSVPREIKTSPARIAS